MPFFRNPVCEAANEAKKGNVTLQVQTPYVNYLISVKRVLSSAFFTAKKGSLTIEAALVLPLFVFCMVILMMPIKIMDKGRQIQVALEASSEKLSQYAYGIEQLKLEEKIEESGMEGLPKELIEAFTKEGILLYVRHQIGKSISLDGVSSVSFSRSSVLEDGETIDIIMDYRIPLPFSVFGLDGVPMTARSCKRAWIGEESSDKEEEGEQEEIVYIGKSSTKYHRERTCHYLYNELRQISFQEVEKVRNATGGKYKPCSRCVGNEEIEGSVFIFPSGERYHKDRFCSSIMSYAQAVPLSSVSHLGACSYCSQ